MKILVVFYSFSGHTRELAQRVQKHFTGAHSVVLEEVKPAVAYSTASAYLSGCFKALREKGVPLQKIQSNPSLFDALIVLSPVWAGRAVPPIYSFIEGLENSAGKPAFVGVTYGGGASKSIESISSKLKKKGFAVKAGFGVEWSKDASKVGAAIEKELSVLGERFKELV